MPFTFALDHPRRRALIIWTHPTSAGAILESLNELATRDAWSYSTLNDCRAVSSIPTTDVVRAVLEESSLLTQRHGRRGPVAFVVSDREALYGMLRMYELLGASHSPPSSSTKVFLDLEAASTWLDGQSVA